MRPAQSAWGLSGPEGHWSSASRFLPRGFSKIPRRISARLSEAMNESSSRCIDIHAGLYEITGAGSQASAKAELSISE